MKDYISTFRMYSALLACVLINGMFTPYAVGAGFTSAQKGFIYRLYSEGHYFQCISETERLVQMTSPANREPFDYFMAVNFFRGYQHSSAIFMLQEQGHEEMPFNHSILVSQAYRWQNNYTKAITALDGYDYEELQSARRNTLFIRRLEIYTDTGNYTGALEEVERARDVFNSPEKFDAMKFSLMDIRHRQVSPVLNALFSSAVPGLGQARTGRYRDAMISFSSIALLGSCTWYLLSKGENAAGAAAGFFLAITYGGNVYGAYNAAKKYNRDAHYRWKEQFRKQYIPAYDPDRYIRKDLLFP